MVVTHAVSHADVSIDCWCIAISIAMKWVANSFIKQQFIGFGPAAFLGLFLNSARNFATPMMLICQLSIGEYLGPWSRVSESGVSLVNTHWVLRISVFVWLPVNYVPSSLRVASPQKDLGFPSLNLSHRMLFIWSHITFWCLGRFVSVHKILSPVVVFVPLDLHL